MVSEFKWKWEYNVKCTNQSVCVWGGYVLRDKVKIYIFYIFVKEYNTSLFIKIIDILQDMGCDRKAGSVTIIVGDILAI